MKTFPTLAIALSLSAFTACEAPAELRPVDPPRVERTLGAQQQEPLTAAEESVLAVQEERSAGLVDQRGSALELSDREVGIIAITVGIVILILLLL